MAKGTAIGLGMQAVGTGMQIGSIYGQAAIQEGNIDSQINAIQLSLMEQEFRNERAVRSLRRQMQQTTSAQEESFISGGVEIEGSALDVIAESMQQFSEAQVMQQREFDFQREQQMAAIGKLKANRRFTQINAAINSASTLLTGAGAMMPRG